MPSKSRGPPKWDRDNAAMRRVGRWVDQGERDEIVLAKQLLAWNQHNKPLIGEADKDHEPVQWALDKVRSVLKNGD